MLAADLVSMVTYDPTETASIWRSFGVEDSRAVNWPELLVLSLQHRVEGLIIDALGELGWYDLVPLSVQGALDARVAVVVAKQAALAAALRELADRAPAAVGDSVMFKGAYLHSLYRRPGHRYMVDVDMLVAEDLEPELGEHFAALGYQLKESFNGPTYLRDDGAGSLVSIDIHVSGPNKYDRREGTLDEAWMTDTEATEIFGVPTRRMSPELQLVNLLIHMHEHAASWRHAVFDDDLRLIRVIDVELLLAAAQPDVRRAWAIAVNLGLDAEFALGCWLIEALRGELPEELRWLEPTVNRVAPAGELYAYPGGVEGRWRIPARVRAYRWDRSLVALELLEREQRGIRRLYDPLKPTAGDEDVGAIAEIARSLMAHPDSENPEDRVAPERDS